MSIINSIINQNRLPIDRKSDTAPEIGALLDCTYRNADKELPVVPKYNQALARAGVLGFDSCARQA